MGLNSCCAASCTGLLAVLAGCCFLAHRSLDVKLPPHMIGHTALEVPDIMTEQDSQELMSTLKRMATTHPYIPSNVADTKTYKTLREHIGEAVPLSQDGKCEHPLMVPSLNRSQCILPGRVDIGMHFLKTGGVDAAREFYAGLLSRLLSFGRYVFAPDDFPVVQKLFASDLFQSSARKVCPPDKQHLDPFQFNFIVQLPGQSVALHLDGVYFNGATRFEFPQWLLAAMQFSGAFQEEFIDQVQVVSYFHDWEPTAQTKGDFVYFLKDGQPSIVSPRPRMGIAIDGTKIVHAASIYRPDVKAPVLDKSKDNILRYFPEQDEWQVLSNGQLLQKYSTSDLRVSIVYRARCFADGAAAKAFNARTEDHQFKLDDILSRLQPEFQRLSGRPLDLRPENRLNMATSLLETFVRYPMPQEGKVPFNYCIGEQIFPWMRPVLRFICD